MSFANDPAEPAARGYSVSLQHSAAAIWGDGFWGRERINPEPPIKKTASSSGRSRSSA